MGQFSICLSFLVFMRLVYVSGDHTYARSGALYEVIKHINFPCSPLRRGICSCCLLNIQGKYSFIIYQSRAFLLQITQKWTFFKRDLTKHLRQSQKKSKRISYLVVLHFVHIGHFGWHFSLVLSFCFQVSSIFKVPNHSKENESKTDE